MGDCMAVVMLAGLQAREHVDLRMHQQYPQCKLWAQPKGKAVMKKPTTKVMKVLKKPNQSTKEKTEKPENTKPEKKQKKWSEGLEKTKEKAEENTEESTEGPEEEDGTRDEVVDPNTDFSVPKETDQKKDRTSTIHRCD